MTKRLLTLLCLSLGLALTGAARAADAPSPLVSISPISGNVDLTSVGKYVWRGLQLTGPSLQPLVQVNAGSFYTWVWSNQPTAKHVQDEMNYTVGWAPTLGSWTLDSGVTAYHYPQAESQRHTIEPYVGVAREVLGLTASLYLYHDYYIHSTSEEGKLSREIELGKHLSLEPSLIGGHVKDPTYYGSYRYWSGAVGLPFKVSSRVKVTPTVSYSSSSLVDQKRNLVWGSLDLNVSF